MAAFYLVINILLFLWCFATGSLIKLVYFSRHEDSLINDRRNRSVKERFGVSSGNRRSYPILGGRLHFVKFETHKINECLDFIHSKQLHRGGKILFPSDYLLPLFLFPYCPCHITFLDFYIISSCISDLCSTFNNYLHCRISNHQSCHSHGQG